MSEYLNIISSKNPDPIRINLTNDWLELRLRYPHTPILNIMYSAATNVLQAPFYSLLYTVISNIIHYLID